MPVERANKTDLAFILAWLEEEFDPEEGVGFYGNRRIIEQSLEWETLWVVRTKGKAVAFQVGNYSADIVVVHKEFQRQGLGSKLFDASLARAFRDNVNLLDGECNPRSSFEYWKSKGFEPIADPIPESGGIPVRKVLDRHYELPEESKIVTVEVNFFNHAAGYDSSKLAEPIRTLVIDAAMVSEDNFRLSQRVIGIELWNPNGRLLIEINIENRGIFRVEGRSNEAEAIGILYDRHGGTYYFDEIKL